jgi:hypothetical protein
VTVVTLPNPAGDCAAMADLLRKAGFDMVEEKTELSVDAMRRVDEGVDYLLPVDANFARDVDVEEEAASLDR